MRFKNLLGLALIFFAALGAAQAQGVVVPIICQRPPRCPVPPPRPPLPIIVPQQLPVKSIQIETKINNQVATTRVEQVFRNDTDATLEGTYFFPIPEEASISEFAIWENDKRLVGEVRSREEARRIYESIVRRQRDPGLLEYAGKNLFQATVFPIPPRSDKKLEIIYTQVLKSENGTVSYRYPLGTGSRAWVANSQPPGGVIVENDSPIRRPTERIGTVSGRIKIENRAGLRNVYSPSHSIDVKKAGDNRATLSFESAGNKEQQDFQLFYAPTREDFGLSLMTYREAARDGYFLLMLSPKDDISEQEFAAKDIVFVLDTSGSMADEGKMEKARKALLFGVNGLRDGDRFNVIGFAGEERLMESNLIRADAAGRRRGVEFVNNLKATGGTNINDALRAAMLQFGAGGDRPKMLVFMTDGLPTVGETNVEKIIGNAREAKKNAEDLHLFTFGVGYDVNTQLLDKLAAENGGTSDYVEPKEDIEVKIGNFFAKVNSPVLTDLEINWGGANVDLIYPRQMPDLFKGSQLAVIGRYRDQANGVTLTLRGKTGRESRNFTYSNVSFPSRAESNDFLPRLWATRRVGWLVEQIRSNGEQKELRDEIVELGTRYGIVTPYTSYLATDGSERGRQQISNLPLNGRNTTPTIGAPRAAAESLSVTSGRGAVQMSRKQKAQQDAVSVQTENDTAIFVDQNLARTVGAKTFYLQNGVWTDAEYKPETKLPEVKLSFASAEYFDLLGKEKDLAQFFALGEQVRVVYKNKVYLVTK